MELAFPEVLNSALGLLAISAYELNATVCASWPFHPLLLVPDVLFRWLLLPTCLFVLRRTRIGKSGLTAFA